MRLPIVQGENAGRAKVISVNSCTNMYPEIQKPGQAKSAAAFRPAPGYEMVAEVDASGPCSYMHVAYYDGFYRLFIVLDSTLYEMDSNEVFYNRGSVSSSNIVRMASNGTQVLITCGQTRYLFDMSTNTMSSNLESYSSNFCLFYNGYFLREDGENGRVYFSASYDGTTWDVLDYMTAEYASDDVTGLAKTSNDILYVFGGKTVELWQPTSDANAPFTRINGVVREIGCDRSSGSKTIASNSQSVFWMGNDKYGHMAVYMSVGYDIKKISTPNIEYLLNSISDSSLYYYDGYCYSYEGHEFYVLSFGYSLDARTIAYDITTDTWHLRTSYNTGPYNPGGYFRQFATQVCVFNGKYYVGHFDNGNIYRMSEDYLTEGGANIEREIITNVISDENKIKRYKSFEIDLENGIGQYGKLYGGTSLNGKLFKYNGEWVVTCAQLGSETNIYSLLVYNDRIYGGTAPNGKLYRLNTAGNAWEEVCDQLGSETHILSIIEYSSRLYGSTYPNGKLYRLNTAGIAWEEVCAKLGSETQILSIIEYSSRLYGGTAPNGKLYRLNTAGNAWEEVCDQLGSETNIESLSVYNSRLYGGTSPNGKLYRLNTAGNAWEEVCAKLGSETHILSLIEYNSRLYGGTHPNGKLYRLNTAGNAWEEVCAQLGSETNIQSLLVYNSRLYGGTHPNGKLYRLNTAGDAWQEVCDQLGSETNIHSLVVYEQNPPINLYLSNDGGHTYGNAISKEAGRESSDSRYYTNRIKYSSLGSARNRVFKIAMDANVKWYISGAYLEVR